MRLDPAKIMRNGFDESNGTEDAYKAGGKHPFCRHFFIFLFLSGGASAVGKRSAYK